MELLREAVHDVSGLTSLIAISSSFSVFFFPSFSVFFTLSCRVFLHIVI